MTEANVVYITFDEAGYEDLVETARPSANDGVDVAGYVEVEVQPRADLATTSLPANKNNSISMRNRTVFLMAVMNTLVNVVVIGLIIILFIKEPTKTEPTKTPPVEGPVTEGATTVVVAITTAVTTSPQQLPTTEADKKTPAPSKTKYPCPYNGYTYKKTSLAQTWFESRHHCQQIGGDLASIGMKNYTLRRMISSYLELSIQEAVWVGAYDFHSEGEWVWVDGSAVDAATAKWYPGRPNSNLARDDCGSILPNPTDDQDQLIDAPCNEQYVAICETKIT